MRPRIGVLLLASTLACAWPARAALPANFVGDTVVSTGIGGPTDLAFSSDGRMFVTRQGGRMQVYSLATTPATQLSTAIIFPSLVTAGSPPPICSNFERG